MRYPLKAKVEKCISKDQTRPVLANAYLRDLGDGAGRIEATDSYKLVRIPVGLDEGDVEGFLPPAMFAAARKERCDGVTCNGDVTIPGAASYPRPDAGQFPDSERLWPTAPVVFTVGVNAKFLYELAQAMDSDTVRLEFVGAGYSPDPLKPFIVTPLAGEADGADGICMPIRVAERVS